MSDPTPEERAVRAFTQTLVHVEDGRVVGESRIWHPYGQQVIAAIQEAESSARKKALEEAAGAMREEEILCRRFESEAEREDVQIRWAQRAYQFAQSAQKIRALMEKPTNAE